MQDIFSITALAIVQGIGEFLPISSSSHTKIVANLLKIENYKHIKLFIEVGTFSATLLYFRSLIIGETIGLFTQNYAKSVKFFAKVLVSCLPFIFFFQIIGKTYSNISLFLVLGSILMFISEKISKSKQAKTAGLDNITFKQAFIVGCFQTLSSFSGFSRSGSTICGGIISGINKKDAVKFSFLISLPLSFASIIYDFYKLKPTLNFYHLYATIICFIIAFISIRPALKIVSNISLNWFGLYRVLLAVLIFNLNIF